MAADSTLRGILCLYRCGETVGSLQGSTAISEATVDETEKIEFDNPRILGTTKFRNHSGDLRPAAQHPDARSGVVSTTISMMRTQTDNAAPFQEESRHPDTGFSGVRYTIHVVFDERDNNYAKSIERLVKWQGEDQFIKGRYANGRIGIRNDFQPEFNLVPDNTSGYKIASVTSTHDGEYHQIRTAEIILIQSGESEQLAGVS